ncbi:MAG: hypothetical protein ACXAC7_04655 [Candidatus Hodarchaeales archaeon]
MDIQIFVQDQQIDVSEENKIFSHPVILQVSFFGLGQFNVNVMRPDGYGTAYYSGWVRTEDKETRTWTIPIREVYGLWKIIVVFHQEDGTVNQEIIEGHLEATIPTTEIEEPIQPIDVIEPAVPDLIDYKLDFPTRDITLWYNTLWVRGITSDEFPMIVVVNALSYLVTGDENNKFFQPIPLEFDSYSLVSITAGGKDNPKFKSSFSVTCAKGGIEEDTDNETLQADEPFRWLLPAEDLATTRKFILFRGWIPVSNTVELNGEILDVQSDRNNPEINLVDFIYPLKLGVNELELKITDKDGKSTRETRWVECMNNKISLQIISPESNFETSNSTKEITGQVTPDSHLLINGKTTSSNPDGFFKSKVKLSKGSNTITIIATQGGLSDLDYPRLRTSDLQISEINWLKPELFTYCKVKGIETIQDFFDLSPDVFMEDIAKNKIGLTDFIQTQKFLGYLLLGKYGLSLFSELEAFCLASVTSIYSMEEIVLLTNEVLLSLIKPICEDLEIDYCPTLDDVSRWQRSLDDFLFEFQNKYLD